MGAEEKKAATVDLQKEQLDATKAINNTLKGVGGVFQKR